MAGRRRRAIWTNCLTLALERPIDARPVDVMEYRAARYPLYRIAQAEGLVA